MLHLEIQQPSIRLIFRENIGGADESEGEISLMSGEFIRRDTINRPLQFVDPFARIVIIDNDCLSMSSMSST